jgi:large subunit ribosomal protein L34e
MPKFKKRVISKTVLRFKKKKTAFAKCARCGRKLHGVPRGRTGEIMKLAKTEKRPERPYGGYYCNKCSREIFKDKVRKLV